VVDAFESPHGPVKLVAMADLFESRLVAPPTGLLSRAMSYTGRQGARRSLKVTATPLMFVAGGPPRLNS